MNKIITVIMTLMVTMTTVYAEDLLDDFQGFGTEFGVEFPSQESTVQSVAELINSDSRHNLIEVGEDYIIATLDGTYMKIFNIKTVEGKTHVDLIAYQSIHEAEGKHDPEKVHNFVVAPAVVRKIYIRPNEVKRNRKAFNKKKTKNMTIVRNSLFMTYFKPIVQTAGDSEDIYATSIKAFSYSGNGMRLQGVTIEAQITDHVSIWGQYGKAVGKYAEGTTLAGGVKVFKNFGKNTLVVAYAGFGKDAFSYVDDFANKEKTDSTGFVGGLRITQTFGMFYVSPTVSYNIDEFIYGAEAGISSKLNDQVTASIGAFWYSNDVTGITTKLDYNFNERWSLQGSATATTDNVFGGELKLNFKF